MRSGSRVPEETLKSRERNAEGRVFCVFLGDLHVRRKEEETTRRRQPPIMDFPGFLYFQSLTRKTDFLILRTHRKAGNQEAD